MIQTDSPRHTADTSRLERNLTAHSTLYGKKECVETTSTQHMHVYIHPRHANFMVT